AIEEDREVANQFFESNPAEIPLLDSSKALLNSSRVLIRGFSTHRRITLISIHAEEVLRLRKLTSEVTEIYRRVQAQAREVETAIFNQMRVIERLLFTS